ncbi:MAG: HlyD family efflux transporter periplasmic adaptor subunit [Acidobacteria bacterium]|nr:HlyD family efflux transporter periplasmic adaptor subunit [Acidobacteriota bacterium]
MSSPLKWIISTVAIAGLVGLLLWGVLAVRGEQQKEPERSAKTPPRTSRTPGAGTVVTLNREAQERIGLKIEVLAAAALQPEVAAYGMLEEDPSRTFLLRAPAAGILRRAANRDWPAVGEQLADDGVIGALDPRFSPAERIDLSARLSAAQADLDATAASVAAARASYERAKTLNAENKNISDRALQEAEARLKGEEARLKSATETAQLIRSSLSAASPSSTPLRVERGGEVTEILAQPGEVVESGQPVMRVARFDRLVARVHLPAGENVDPSVSSARIIPFGREDNPLRGERIALGAAIDPKVQGQAFLSRLAEVGFPLRPGAAVTAYLKQPGGSLQGVVIPPAAAVRFAGRAWAYVQTDGEQFLRREVSVDRSTERGLFSRKGFSPGDRIVVVGAQLLLSEELKWQFRSAEEGVEEEEK